MTACRMAALAAVAWLALAGTARAEDQVAAGHAIFEHTCAICHSTAIGVNKIGPSLWHVINRPIASVQDFPYSAKLRSMKAEWGTWTPAHLDEYLINPRQIAHGVKMYFKGLPNAQDRAAVIAYLGTLQ